MFAGWTLRKVVLVVLYPCPLPRLRPHPPMRTLITKWTVLFHFFFVMRVGLVGRESAASLPCSYPWRKIARLPSATALLVPCLSNPTRYSFEQCARPSLSNPTFASTNLFQFSALTFLVDDFMGDYLMSIESKTAINPAYKPNQKNVHTTRASLTRLQINPAVLFLVVQIFICLLVRVLGW